MTYLMLTKVLPDEDEAGSYQEPVIINSDHIIEAEPGHHIRINDDTSVPTTKVRLYPDRTIIIDIDIQELAKLLDVAT